MSIKKLSAMQYQLEMNLLVECISKLLLNVITLVRNKWYINIYINIKSSFETEHPLLQNTGFATDYNILTLVECVYHGNSSMLNFNLWGF